MSTINLQLLETLEKVKGISLIERTIPSCSAHYVFKILLVVVLVYFHITLWFHFSYLGSRNRNKAINSA